MAYIKKSKKRPVFDGVPRCATREQFSEWQKLARNCPPRKGGFCEDCLPEYQNKMIAEGRCQYPWVVFKIDKDGEMFGSLPPLTPLALLD